jgi:hypothetical protein
MVEKAKDGNLAEGKTPEEMKSEELEQFITLQSTVIPVDAQGKKEEEKEPEKEKEKDVQLQEKPEKGKEKEIKEVKEEKLILGKFKTQEDFIKAYQEAEKKISQQGEEVAKERKLREEREQREEQERLRQYAQISQQQDPLAPLRARYPGWADEQLIPILEISGAIANQALKNYAEAQKRELEPLYEIKFEKDVERQKNVIRNKYPDYVEFEGEVNDKLSTLPPSLRAKDGSVETIFLTVRGEHVPELTQRAREEAQKQVSEIEKKKEDAFVEGGGKTAVPTPPIDIGKMSSKQIEELIKQQQKRK